MWGWIKRLFRRRRTDREVATRYFEDHREAHDDVMKAAYAYHDNIWPYNHQGRHSFASLCRTSACSVCGRTREQVRWDDLPPQCEAKEQPVIADTIRGEEEKFFAMQAKAKAHVPRLVAKMGLSGETLATLHHTHGYCPETVAAIVEVPPNMMMDYYAAMEIERERSRKSQIKEVITVDTTGN